MATTKKVTELTAANSAANTDLLYLVADPSGVPASKKITVQNLLAIVNNVSLAANAYSNAIAKFGTIVISNNVISTSNSSDAITVRTSNNPFNAISNSYVQLQYNANSSVSHNQSAGSNWLWVDADGVNMQVINSTAGTLSEFYLSNSAVTMTVNSSSLSLNSNGSVTYPDSTVQTTAYTGRKTVTLVNTTIYTPNTTQEVLLCDPNAAGASIAIYLPNSVANGTVYTVKNINDGGFDVYVYANGSPNIIEVHGVGTFSANDTLSQSGNVVSWIYYNGVYRVISSA